MANIKEIQRTERIEFIVSKEEKRTYLEIRRKYENKTIKTY